MPTVDSYPKPVALTALDLCAQAGAAVAGREGPGRAPAPGSARRNRDVAWLLEEHQRLAKPVKPAKPAKAVKTGTP